MQRYGSAAKFIQLARKWYSIYYYRCVGVCAWGSSARCLPLVVRTLQPRCFAPAQTPKPTSSTCFVVFWVWTAVFGLLVTPLWQCTFCHGIYLLSPVAAL